MLQADAPDDYVVGTGEGHSVRDFLEIAFQHVGYDYREFVIVDPTYFRPAEIYDLLADPSKAKERLGWNNQYGFPALVKEMVESDLACLG